MVRRTPPYREIAGRIVVGQASRLTEWEPLIEEYAVEINTAENVGFGQCTLSFTGFGNGWTEIAQ